MAHIHRVKAATAQTITDNDRHLAFMQQVQRLVAHLQRYLLRVVMEGQIDDVSLLELLTDLVQLRFILAEDHHCTIRHFCFVALHQFFQYLVSDQIDQDFDVIINIALYIDVLVINRL